MLIYHSKKQLTTRLKLWGMRKNTKLGERAAIVQKHGDTMNGVISNTSGFKVGRAKFERWQKEMKDLKPPGNSIRDSGEGTSKSTYGDYITMWLSIFL
jgi:hypothetical protein